MKTLTIKLTDENGSQKFSTPITDDHVVTLIEAFSHFLLAVGFTSETIKQFMGREDD